MIRKIVTGGQTGADRAALDAALEKGLPIGGFCPGGRMAEDGPIDKKYILTEIDGGYPQRTKMNVEHSDGTLVFYQCDLTGGTEQPVAFCISSQKPYKLIDLDLVCEEMAAQKILEFIEKNSIGIVNVAGPRMSECPSIYDFVKNTIKLII